MLCEKLNPAANLVGDQFKLPSLNYVYKFRIVIMTLHMKGNIVRAREANEIFKPSHFGYIFIDEAASCHETAALIPIAGIFICLILEFAQV